MGLYHRSCLLHWLSVSGTYCCEICKFHYELGRHKPSFRTYLRTHWLGRDGILANCIIAVIFSSLCFGGAIFTIHILMEGYQQFTVIGITEALLCIFVGGIAAFFVITVGISVIYPIVFHVNDFRNWRDRNAIIQVVDQRRLSIKRRLRKFLRSVIPSPSSRPSHISGPASRESNVPTSILTGTSDHTFDEASASSKFRPHYTAASAKVLVSTSKKISPCSMQLSDHGIGSSDATVYTPSCSGDASGHVRIGAVDEIGSTSAGTSPRVETPL